MNCDRVFQILTRGPFPSGAAEDVLVDEHLDRCTSCWRIAEALRPAHDLFQESLSPIESRHLPGYWGDTMPPGADYDDLLDESRCRPGTAGSASGTRLATQPAPTVYQAPARQAEPPANWARLLLVAGAAAIAGGTAVGMGWPFG